MNDYLKGGVKSTPNTPEQIFLSRLIAVMYFNAKRREQALKDYKIDRFKYDRDLTDGRYGVFVDSRRKQIVFVVRGTDFANVNNDKKNDILVDSSILTGTLGLTKRFKEAGRKLVKFIIKYAKEIDGGAWKIFLTGHSLGGAIVRKLAENNKKDLRHIGIRAITFSEGKGLNALIPFNILKRFVTKDDVISFSSRGDLISILNRLTNPDETIVRQKKSEKGFLGPHSIQNFTGNLLKGAGGRK